MITPLMAISAIALFAPVEATPVTPESFRTWFDASIHKELVIPPCVAKQASHHRYIFVGGLRGEGMHEEFMTCSRDLRERGVSKHFIHVIHPSSHGTIEENAVSFRREIHRIVDAGPEPVVVIAHSRGACDTLFFALNNPEFTEHHIRAMFLIQGPFGGSGLADFVMGEGPPVDNQLSPLHRSLATIFGDFERFKMKKGQHGGIADMTRDASHRFWTSAVESHPDAVAQIAPRIFYIEGETESSRLKLFLRATGSYLHLHYGPNDGVVARGDQSLRGLGTSLGVYNAGHSDLTRKNPGSKQGKRTRRAFVDAIFVAVGQPGGS